MNPKLLLSLLVSTGLCVALAGPAQATMIAGWDFSQYSTDGALSIDEQTLTNTLAANYSDLAEAGPSSAGFGTMHLDGQFGSTDTPLDFTDPFVPSGAAPGSLASNLDAPAGDPFESFLVLEANGQPFRNPFTMTALAAATVVFETNVFGPAMGENWSVSFGGKTNSGTSMVNIDFSTNGTTFTPFGSVNLTNVDTPFTVNLGTALSDTAYLRLSFSPDQAGGQQTFLDNLAFNANLVGVPEPATAALLLASLVGLARAGRRRD